MDPRTTDWRRVSGNPVMRSRCYLQRARAQADARCTERHGTRHPVMPEGLGPYRPVRLAAAVSNARDLGTIDSPGIGDEAHVGARLRTPALAELAVREASADMAEGELARFKKERLIAGQGGGDMTALASCGADRPQVYGRHSRTWLSSCQASSAKQPP